MLNGDVNLSNTYNYLYYIDRTFPFVKFRSWQLRSCCKTSIAVKAYSCWLINTWNELLRNFLPKPYRESIRFFRGQGASGERERRTYTRKLPWARNEICQEMRFSARAVMYAARINGGSVENEFSVAANNKEKEREKDRKER